MKERAHILPMVLLVASAYLWGCADSGSPVSGDGGDAVGDDSGSGGGDAGGGEPDGGGGSPDAGQADAGQADAGGDAGGADGGVADAGTLPDAETPTALADATPGWFGQLAFSPPADSWLVVTQSGGVVGRIMGNDGAPVTDVFSVSPPEQNASWAPSIAYAPDADVYLVVWVDYTNDGWQAWGRFVGGDGAMPGAAFALALDKPVPNQGGDRTSSLAYDPKNNRFVYAWHGTHLVTIGMDGSQGTIVDIVGADDPTAHWGASVAVNPDKNEYCVAYDRRNGPSIALSRVDAATMSAGAESTAAITSTNVLVAYNTVEKNYLYVYDTGYVTGVKAKLLGSCDLNDVAAEFDVLPAEGTASVAYNPASNMYAVIAQNADNDGNTWAVFDSTGAVLATGDPYLGASNGNYAPEIAPNITDGTFAAISSRDYTQTRFVANIGFKTHTGR